MRSNEMNPESNQLPAGLNETSLLDAIETSGYPLQGIIAQTLTPDFGVTEEWGYIDRDSQDHRALDIFAYKNLGQTDSVNPSLVLLIECKRSRQPYVFFKSVIDRPPPYFPKVTGIPRNFVEISEKGRGRLSEVPSNEALGLAELEFVEPGPPKCAAFTKAVPKGSKVELSGTDPFNSLVLPLTKALDHAAGLFKAQGQDQKLFPSLVLSISVVDAPMLLIDGPKIPKEPILVPWVRIVRQEANARDKRAFYWSPWHRFYSIDVVHADYFDAYINTQVLPFANQYAERAMKMADILIRGGEVESLDNWSWQEVHPLPAKQHR